MDFSAVRIKAEPGLLPKVPSHHHRLNGSQESKPKTELSGFVNSVFGKQSSSSFDDSLLDGSIGSPDSTTSQPSKKGSNKDKESMFKRVKVDVKCEMCGTQYDSKATYLVHSPCYYSKYNVVKPEVEDEKEIYKCMHPGCDKAFARMNYLRRHVAYHYDRNFLCKKCDFKGFTQRDIIRHLVVHTGEKKFQCPKCDRTFAYRQMLAEHLRRHEGQKPYLCNFPGCSSAFPSHNGLKDHAKRHKEPLSTMYSLCQESKKNICTACGEMFNQVSKYIAHRPCFFKNSSVIDSPTTVFDCGYCDEKVTTFELLVSHYATHFDGKPEYRCHTCDRKFASEKEAEHHVATHRSPPEIKPSFVFSSQ